MSTKWAVMSYYHFLVITSSNWFVTNVSLTGALDIMKMHLTQGAVESLNQSGEYRDDEVKGLLVRVSVNRKGKIERIYKLNARIKGGKVITTTLGPHGRSGKSGVFTLEQARAWAQEMLRDMRGGGSEKLPVNPNVQIRKLMALQEVEREKIETESKIKAYTLRKALADYLDFKIATANRSNGKRRGELSPNTANLYRQCINKHLLSWLDKPVCDISRQMVLERYKKVCKVTEAGAGNTFRALRAILNWIIKKEEGAVLSSNPVDVLSALDAWKEVEPREEIISDLQLRRWWLAVESLGEKDQADYFKMLLLTGLRKSELGGMKWNDINFEAQYWTVRNTKNGRDHSLPFSRYTEEILKKRFASDTRDATYVFAGRSVEGCLKDVEHVQNLIVAECGIEFSPHMLRRTFSSVAGRELQDYLVKRLVNHHNKQDVTQNHYIVLKDVNILRRPLQQVEDFILKHALGAEVANKPVRRRRSG